MALFQEVDGCPDLSQTEILLGQREQAIAESTEASSARKRKQCEARKMEKELEAAEIAAHDCDEVCREQRSASFRMCNSRKL